MGHFKYGGWIDGSAVAVAIFDRPATASAESDLNLKIKKASEGGFLKFFSSIRFELTTIKNLIQNFKAEKKFLKECKK